MSIDLFGHAEPAKQCRDIRNQRPSTAEDKAVLCKQLLELCHRPPESVVNGGVQLTRRWIADSAGAKKVAASPKSSVPQLMYEVAKMRGYLGP